MENKKIFYVTYDFRWDFICVTLFAENELDARQKADHYVFNKSRYPIPRNELKETDLFELLPSENGIIDAEHSSHD